MIKLAIIRFEGVKDPEELQVYLDNKFITRESAEQDITISLKAYGILKISVKPNLKPQLYTTFDLKLLPNEGFQWIPLSNNPLSIIQEFPEEVCDPKVLVMVSSEFDDSTKPECETCILLKEQNKSLQQDLANLIVEIKNAKDHKSLHPAPSPTTLESLSAENEKNKALVKKLSTLYSDLSKQIDQIQTKYEEEHKHALILSEKVRNLTQAIEENSTKSKMREQFLETLLNDREKEYKKSSKHENHPSTIPSDPLQIQTNPKELQEKFQSASHKILTEITNTSISRSNTSQSKETESAIKSFLSKTSRKGLFTKDQGNLYKFGKKKVFVTLRHGQLLCRVGGGFEAIEEFIQKNQESKTLPFPEKTHSRHKTLDLTQDPTRSTSETEKLLRSRVRPLSSYISDYP